MEETSGNLQGTPAFQAAATAAAKRAYKIIMADLVGVTDTVELSAMIGGWIGAVTQIHFEYAPAKWTAHEKTKQLTAMVAIYIAQFEALRPRGPSS